jgi:Uma2 family endonuclease
MLDVDQLLPETVRPLRRAEFERLAELGMFDDERVELLAGQIITMTPPGSPDSESVRRLTHLLVLALNDRAQVGVQLPLAISEISEPQPDLAVVPPGDYSHAHPTAALLLIEVAESSLRKDRLVKAALYAAAGIPEYWIVDIAGRALELYREPHGETYAQVARKDERETVSLLAFPDVRLAVREILPTP